MIAHLQRRQRGITGHLVRGPSEFRQLLERLGPIFIKIGQFLALRPDLVPQEYCDELMKLLDDCSPFSWDDAKAILREELRVEPEEIFAYVNTEPLAAGSLAQTHLARLYDGTELAVKIMRPGIAAQVKRDLRRARLIARLMELSSVTFIASPTTVVKEISEWMMQEIDLERELANVIRLYDLTQSSKIQRVPQPYRTLSSARVLTMEYLRGLPFSDLIIAIRRPKEAQRLKALGIDCDGLASNLIKASLEQMFTYKFFHADLHPGNLLALPGNVVGFVDFGLCDHLDETFRLGQMRYLTAVYGNDVDGMFKALTDLLVATEKTNMSSFKTDFFAETGTYLSQVSDEQTTRTNSGQRSPIAAWMIRVVRAGRRNHLRIPSGILLMYRTLLTAESVAQQLSGTTDLRRLGHEFFRRLRFNELLGTLSAEGLEPTVLSLLTLWRDSPGQVQQILSDMSKGRLELFANMSEASRLRSIRNQRSRLIATAISTIAVAVLLTSSRLPSLSGISLAWPLGTLVAFLFLSILWQWRRLR